MHRNRYLGMQIFKNFSEDDMPIFRCISVTPHLWYLTDTYVYYLSNWSKKKRHFTKFNFSKLFTEKIMHLSIKFPTIPLPGQWGALMKGLMRDTSPGWSIWHDLLIKPVLAQGKSMNDLLAMGQLAIGLLYSWHLHHTLEHTGYLTFNEQICYSVSSYIFIARFVFPVCTPCVLASNPGSLSWGESRAWYALFVHVPEILEIQIVP